MIELLEKLKQQATEVEFYSPTAGITKWKFNEEKFAELIIKECLDLFEDDPSESLTGQMADDRARYIIRKHFGLQE